MGTPSLVRGRRGRGSSSSAGAVPQETLQYHYGKHHRAYVTNLNKQIEGTELAGKSLEDIIHATWSGGSPKAPFNNAAQVRHLVRPHGPRLYALAQQAPSLIGNRVTIASFLRRVGPRFCQSLLHVCKREAHDGHAAAVEYIVRWHGA